ncbi:MAG: PD-(D/E)XK nuclease family protein [Coriobacteriales bacterium]|nr:PD-(D/E)XK nuclease family protein [Coriobacteriales bacterium]
MALNIVWTREEDLTNACVLDALRGPLAQSGAVTLLTPTFDEALGAQRVLSGEPGLCLGVTTTTPAGWVRDRWEVWGDGRALADDVALFVLARDVVLASSEADRGPLLLSEGLVHLLSQLVDTALPWLPLNVDGSANVAACQAAGLSHAETLLMGLAGKLGAELAARGYVSRSEASLLLPHSLRDAGAQVPDVVVAGFSSMGRRDRELLVALGDLCDVCVVIHDAGGAAAAQARHLAAQLGCDTDTEPLPAKPKEGRAPALEALRQALFSGRVRNTGEVPVELLHATGPVAEAELIAQRVSQLVAEADAHDSVVPVVLAVPDCTRARRELVPKLAARGLRVRSQESQAMRDAPTAQAFFSFARTVASLADLADEWPGPREGLEGPVPQLGDMSWWPPRELVDFLLNEISHVSASKAWRLDALWRGNRLLTPQQVLDMLQSERDTSAPVARATAELLRGRIGSAASKLLAPFVEKNMAADLASIGGEAPATLTSVLRIAGTLRSLGVSADPANPDAIPLGALVRLCEWVMAGTSTMSRTQAGVGRPQVLLLSVRQAQSLPACSAHALVVAGCTAQEQPIQAEPKLLDALLECVGVESAPDPLAAARASFASLVGVARDRLVFERALSDADGKQSYPSVMLTELLAAYGVEPGEDPAAQGICVRTRPETDLCANRMPKGMRPLPCAHDNPSPAGRLTTSSRELVFVPQNGMEHLAGGKPVLSASQIETYLDCPLKWFSLRRLRLGTVDAGHSGMEMGTFAHRVLEKTHSALLVHALGADAAIEQEGDASLAMSEEWVRALGEEHLCEHVEGSRVTYGNLAYARSVLAREFDLHSEHMYLAKSPRVLQQLLVPHDSFERAQEQALKDDLLSSLEFQARILTGFEPRLFEWSFGRGEDPVEYAGAYITGTVDRIDVSPHGTAVIIDYKHKSPTGFRAEYDALQDGVLEGVRLPNRVQSLIYAQVVRRAFEGRLRLVGTVYLSTKSPHTLAGAADENVADLVFGNLHASRRERVCVPSAEDGSSGMGALLDQTEELIAEQVSQMMAGNVEARPRDRRSCDFCPVMQCERRVMQ